MSLYRRYPIDFYLGGDYPWVNAALGLNTHNSAYPCNLCVVKSDKLSLYKESAIATERAAGGLKRRTLQDERVRAHDFDESTPPAERKCPCCTLRFPTPADAKKYVAEMTKTAAKEYPSKHYGKRPGQSPLWKVEGCVVVCLLHLVLAHTCLLWRYFVQARVLTEEKAEAVTTKLKKELYIDAKKIKKEFTKQLSDTKRHASMPKRPSFNGKACATVLRHFEDFLVLTMPAATGPHSPRAKADKVLAAWRHLLALLDPEPPADEEDDDPDAPPAKPLKPEEKARRRFRCFDTQAKRDAVAKEVQAAATAYTKALVDSCVSNDALNIVYFHLVVEHLADQARTLTLTLSRDAPSLPYVTTTYVAGAHLWRRLGMERPRPRAQELPDEEGRARHLPAQLGGLPARRQEEPRRDAAVLEDDRRARLPKPGAHQVR